MLPVPVLGLTGVLEVMSIYDMDKESNRSTKWRIRVYYVYTESTPDVVIKLFIAISM